MARALLAWVRGLHAARERRALKAQVLAAAARVLRRRKLARVMAAWREAHVRTLLEHLQVRAAVARVPFPPVNGEDLQRQSVRGGVALWTVQEARAASHWRAARQRAALAAWQQAVRRAHWKQIMAARARQHWSERCLARAAWPAWRDFMRRRRAKAQTLREAGQHRAATLLRHGLAALR